MKHSVTQRLASAALSAVLVVGTLPTAAFADALNKGEASHALAAQGIGSWEHDGKSWRYRLPGGGLATGWQDVDGTWYLFDQAGAMLTGWQKVGNTWYYLGSSGGMYSARWLLDGQTWYYLLRSGAMATGWSFIGGAWYYFYPSGAMAQSTVVDDCWLRADGAWDNDAIPNGDYDMAELTCADVIDPAATSALITVTADSEHPFAQGLTADTVYLAGDFEGAFSIESVKRTDTHAVEIAIKGAFNQETELFGVGGIYFDQGSFENAESIGLAGVSVQATEAQLLVDECAYDDATGLFNISVNTGSAQLLADTSASLPSDQTIEVQSVDAKAGETTLVASVKAPGDNAYQQLYALSVALNDGGLLVSGTSAGSVTAKLSDEDYASVLDYLLPSGYFYVERGADGKGWVLDTDGGASIVLRLRMETENGDFDLHDADLNFLTEGVDPADWSVVDAHAIEFVADKLTKEQLTDYMAECEYDDQAEFLDTYAHLLGSEVAEGIELYGGAITEWGIKLPDNYEIPTLNVYNNVGLGDSVDLEDPKADESGMETQSAGLETQADERYAEVERAKKAMKVVKHVSTALTLAAGVLGGLAMAGPVGAVIGALAGLFGIIAEALMPKGFNEQDVFNEMLALNSQMEGISAQIGDINAGLSALSNDITYKTQVMDLKELVDKANAYRPAVVQFQNAVKDAEDRDTFNILKDDPSNSVTGQAMQKLVKRTEFKTKAIGKGDSAYNTACKLADMISGNSAAGSQSIVQGYFDYTADMVNWEPETFYMRNMFVAYVGSAFQYVFAAANNQLKWELRGATDETDKAIIEESINNLARKAKDVSDAIGENGRFIAGTQDRADGKVRNTVNGRLYEKATSDGNHPAVTHAYLFTSWGNFNSSFDNLLKDPYNEDSGQPYSNENTLTRANLETMAKRLAFVRTQPGFDGKDGTRKANSIYDELICVGLLTSNPTESKGTKDKTWNKLDEMTWDTSYQFQYAVVSNSKMVNKSDMSSCWHKRWHNAEMYDIKSNSYAGSKEIFYYKTWYHCGKGWMCDVQVKTPLYFRAS